jgi:dolichol kinase
MNEYLRKTAHLIFGLLIAGVIAVFPTYQAAMIIGFSLYVGLILIDLCMKGYRIPGISDIILHMERDACFPGKGAFFFVFSALVTLMFFPQSVAAVAVAVLAVLDGFSTIIGIRFGKHKVWKKKTLEGFLGGFIITALLLLLITNPVYAVLISLTAGLVELFSPVDDNLIIPWVVAILITLL